MSEQKLVIDKKKLSELVDNIRFNIQRIRDAYRYAILEREDTHGRRDVISEINVYGELFATALDVSKTIDELDEKGAEPRLLIAGQKLTKFIESVLKAIGEYDMHRYDIEFKGFKRRWVRGRTIKKPVYKAILPKSIVREAREEMKELHEILGRKCGFSIPYKDDVTVSEALNDVSNCIHVYAEEIMNTMGKTFNEIPDTDGKVKADETADKDLIEIAITWYKSLEQGIINNLYISEDVRETKSYIVDGRAYFRVGSSEGHATSIEKLDNELVVRYYDSDEAVNTAVTEILEDKGDCRCEKLDDGVKCRCKLTPKTKKAVAITMALATSMDIRMYEDGEDIMDQMKHYKEIEEHLNKPHVREEIEQVIHAWRNMK